MGYIYFHDVKQVRVTNVSYFKSIFDLFFDGRTQPGPDYISNSFNEVMKDYALEAPLSDSRLLLFKLWNVPPGNIVF